MRRRVTVLLGLVLVLGVAAPALAQEGSIGIVDTSTGEWYLRDPATGATTRFFYGNPGDLPMVGDWDCDGDETPGLYRQSDGFVYLRNLNSQGAANIRFFFGNPGDIPLAGDFDGDGCDTVSIYRPSESRVFIINTLGANEGGLGAADFAYYFGNPGDKPFVGDFNNDGVDTIGLHRESTGLVYFRQTHTQGNADSQFIFGDPGDKIVAAEWATRGVPGPESVGLFRPSTCTSYLRHTNTQGVADVTLTYGVPTGLPVAGDFGALPGGGSPPSGCATVAPPPPPPGGFQAFTINGSGNAVVDLAVPGDAPALIDLAHNGSSNFIVWSLNGAFGQIDLLVNEIGSYSGRRGLNTGWFSSSGLDPVRHLEIDADGSWTLTVRPMTQARVMTGSLNGHGDEIVRYQAGSVMHSTHHGTSNFVIWALRNSGALHDLIVNEIGPYNASDVVPAGTAFLEITADGNWTLGP